LDLTRPAPPSRNSRKKGSNPGIVDKELKKSITQWRKEIWNRDFGDSLFGPSALLSDASIDSLSSFGNIERLIDLEQALGGYWAWFGKYGDDLLSLFGSLDVAPKKPKTPKPRATRGTKRAAQALQNEGDESGCKDGQTKRGRTSNIAGNTPAPVNPRPTPSTSRAPPPPPTPLRPPVPTYPQPGSSNVLAYNPYAVLMTPPTHLHHSAQTPFPPVPFPYYYPPSTPSSSSPFAPYPYFSYPPGPPHPSSPSS